MSTQTMRALTVKAWGSAPTLSNLPIPSPSAGQTVVKMIASGLAQLVKSQAAGTHYSVQGVPLPYVPGVDGVGTTPDGRLVHVNLLAGEAKGGALAEHALVPDRALTPVPVADGASDADKKRVAVKVAALMNPALSSWMALKHRAHVDGFAATSTPWNVLVVGATSASGRVAALFARHLGAERVIGAARDAAALSALREKGTLDESIVLDEGDASKTDWSAVQKLEMYPLVVLDYVYGATALSLFEALPRAASRAEELEVRYVHVGALGRQLQMSVDGSLLRSKNVTISGSGPGSWSMKALAREMPGMIGAIVDVVPTQGWMEEYGVVEKGLEEAETAWDAKGRTVFVM